MRSKKNSMQVDTSSSGNQMSKVLGAVDLTFMGIGGIIGAGVFVLTGVAARQEAGCALFLCIPVRHSCRAATIAGDVTHTAHTLMQAV